MRISIYGRMNVNGPSAENNQAGLTNKKKI